MILRLRFCHHPIPHGDTLPVTSSLLKCKALPAPREPYSLSVMYRYQYKYNKCSNTYCTSQLCTDIYFKTGIEHVPRVDVSNMVSKTDLGRDETGGSVTCCLGGACLFTSLPWQARHSRNFRIPVMWGWIRCLPICSFLHVHGYCVSRERSLCHISHRPLC